MVAPDATPVEAGVLESELSVSTQAYDAGVNHSVERMSTRNQTVGIFILRTMG
jgi:hypothetical protein